jgi:pescadillo protein
MGREKKKGESGSATNYISRNQALKKLQLSLSGFRRLCILKGIYPHEPKNKKKVNRGSTANKTYYYVKDIQYLAHEPLLVKFRDFKAFVKKFKKALGRNEVDSARRLRENKPIYSLDHIVKERFPTFVDALRDLDDALSMLFLFSTFPVHGHIQAFVVQKCRKLSVEFMLYVIASQSLRKTFVSIKGIYFQAEIHGQTITWVVPHHFSQEVGKLISKVSGTFSV